MRALSKFRNGTAQDRHRRCTVERPSEAATSSSTSVVNRVRRDPAGSPVKEWVTCITAGPGEAGWNPVDAHTRQKPPADPSSIPSKGMPPGEGTFPFPVAVLDPLSPPGRTSRPQWRRDIRIRWPQPTSVIQRARAMWVSYARRARSGSPAGSMRSTIRHTSSQVAERSAAASSRRR